MDRRMFFAVVAAVLAPKQPKCQENFRFAMEVKRRESYFAGNLDALGSLVMTVGSRRRVNYIIRRPDGRLVKRSVPRTGVTQCSS